MHDYVLLYVNGRRHEVRGEIAFSSLTDFLRNDLRLTGTKVVCAEGDCGACTVLVGRMQNDALHYEPVDACIQFIYQLDSKHVVTVEGLATNGVLHPVQQAMIDCHGSQCGFCTPGFVMALAGLFEQQKRPDKGAIQTALTGNLCRCTGYSPILNAAFAADGKAYSALTARYADEAMMRDLRRHAGDAVLVQSTATSPGKRRIFFAPTQLAEAIDFKARHPAAVIVSGGTELGVLRNKKDYDPPTLLSLASVPGLASIGITDEGAAIGANVTWTQVERFARERLPELYKIIIRFGSPQIRNVATFVANVAHGSPIADSLPFLCVMDAEVELVSRTGTRRVNINRFYKGYKVRDLTPEEIITRILVPLPAAGELLKLYKVSRRNDLDIATFGAGIRLRRAGDIITRAHLAYSGVGPTVVRLPATEAFLQGKRLTEATLQGAGRLAREEIEPISDVRGSRDFRLLLANNILLKFYRDSLETEAVV